MTTASGTGWTMHLGNCLDVMATLDGVDQIITDPPYSEHVHTKSRRGASLPPAAGFEAITICHPKGRKKWNGGGRQGVWTHPVVQNDTSDRHARVHTAQKPLGLMLDLVRDFTDPGETVLDAYAGSGTTGAACLRLGRRFIGIEKDPKYFALACDRLRAEEGTTTLHAIRSGQGALFGGGR